MKYNYTIGKYNNNSNQSVQTDSSDENDASENVQTIYSVPVSIVLYLSNLSLSHYQLMSIVIC